MRSSDWRGTVAVLGAESWCNGIRYLVLGFAMGKKGNLFLEIRDIGLFIIGTFGVFGL